MEVTKAFWGELERSGSDPQKAVGKCAGEQMPLANALASKCRWQMRWRANAVGKCAGEQMPLANALASKCRWQMRWKSASGGCKLASAVGCRLSAVSWRGATVGWL